MAEDNINKCNDCGLIFSTFEENNICPRCNSKRKILKVKVRSMGHKKPFMEMVSGEELSVQENKYVQKHRIIDRENDKYHEKVTDLETGEIIHECAQKLSEHVGHGSAKKRMSKK